MNTESKKNIFFSYGHDDNENLVQRLKEDIEKVEEGKKFRVWIDKEQIKTGDDWRKSIVDGITNSHVVAAYLSKHSVRDPGVCRDELRIALGISSCRIITVLLEPYDVAPPPLTISHIQYLDMSAWKEEKKKGDISFVKWYEDKLQKILYAIERENSVSGDIAKLCKLLKPSLKEYSYLERMGFLLRGNLIERSWLLKSINTWLNNPSGNRIYCLTGEPGLGKSVIAALVASESVDVGTRVVGVHFCQHGSFFDHPKTVFTQLAFQLATRMPSYLATLISNYKKDWWRKANALEVFKHVFCTIARDSIDGARPTHFFIIDALDEAPEELLKIIAENKDQMPTWLRFFVTSRPAGVAQNDYLDLLAPQFLDAHSEQNKNDVRQYIDTFLKTQEFLNDEEKHHFAVALSTAALGNFRYVSLILQNITNKLFTVKEFLDGRQFPIGLSGLYMEHFKRAFKNVRTYKSKVRPLLDMLTVSTMPVPMQILTSAIGISENELIQLLLPLKSFVFHNYNLFHLYHRSIQEWLKDASKSGDYATEPKRGHTFLAKSLLLEVDKAIEEKRTVLGITGKQAVSTFCLYNFPLYVRNVASDEKGQIDKHNLIGIGMTAKKLRTSFSSKIIFIFGSPRYYNRACVEWLQLEIEMRIALFGLDDTSTLASKRTLARHFIDIGKTADAYSLFKQILEIQEKKSPLVPCNT